MKRFAVVALLALIAVAGAALRLYELDGESLWNDELSTWVRADYPTPADVLAKGMRGDSHPPGWQLIMWAVVRASGASEIALRMPAAIAGILSIPVIFLLGRRLYGTFEGLVAAALFAVAWAPVNYAQEARANALLMLCAMLATWVWHVLATRCARGERPPPGLLATYGALALFTAYIHYYGLLLVAIQGGAALVGAITLRRWRGPVIALYGILALTYVPWVPVMLATHARGPVWIPRPQPIPRAFLRMLRFFFNRNDLFLRVALAGYGLLAIGLAVRGWGRRPDIRRIVAAPDFLLVAWLVLPFLGTWLLSMTIFPILLDRSLLVSLPAAYLLLARAFRFVPVPGRSVRRELVGGLLAAALVAGLAFDLVVRQAYYSKVSKDQFREAVRWIVARDPAGKVPVVGFAWNAGYFNYYFARAGMPDRVRVMAGLPGDERILRRAVAEGGGRAWYAAGHRSPDPAFLREVGRDLAVAERKRFFGVDVRRLVDRRISGADTTIRGADGRRMIDVGIPVGPRPRR